MKPAIALALEGPLDAPRKPAGEEIGRQLDPVTRLQRPLRGRCVIRDPRLMTLGPARQGRVMGRRHEQGEGDEQIHVYQDSTGRGGA